MKSNFKPTKYLRMKLRKKNQLKNGQNKAELTRDSG